VKGAGRSFLGIVLFPVSFLSLRPAFSFDSRKRPSGGASCFPHGGSRFDSGLPLQRKWKSGEIMHAYESVDGSLFQYNSDFSGDIEIKTPDRKRSIKIPARDILQFVADCYVRPYKISEIEQAPWTKLLQKGEHP